MDCSIISYWKSWVTRLKFGWGNRGILDENLVKVLGDGVNFKHEVEGGGENDIMMGRGSVGM